VCVSECDCPTKSRREIIPRWRFCVIVNHSHATQNFLKSDLSEEDTAALEAKATTDVAVTRDLIATLEREKAKRLAVAEPERQVGEHHSPTLSFFGPLSGFSLPLAVFYAALLFLGRGQFGL
jgi:hypothetical protein